MTDELDNAMKQEQVYSDNMVKEFLDLTQAKNVLPQSTFCRYAPLYTKNAGVPEEHLRKLATEFNTTVNPYAPITVYNDTTKEVMFTLPPMLTRVATIGTEVLERNSDLVERFTQISSNPQQPRSKRNSIRNELFEAYLVSQQGAVEERNVLIENHQMQVKKKLNVGDPLQAGTTAAVNTDDWNWE